MQKNKNKRLFVRIRSQLLILLMVSGISVFGQVPVEISIPGTGRGIAVGADDLNWSYYGYWNTSPGIQFAGQASRTTETNGACTNNADHEVECVSEVPFDENGIVHGGATVYFYYSFTVTVEGDYVAKLNVSGGDHAVDIAKWVGVNNGGDALGMVGVVSKNANHTACEYFELTAHLTPGDHMIRVSAFTNGPQVPAVITVSSLGGDGGNCVPTLTMSSASNVTTPSGVTVTIPLTTTNNVSSTYIWTTAGNSNTTLGGSTHTTSNTPSNTISETITNLTTTPQIVTYTVTPTSISGSCKGQAQIITITINPPVSCQPADFISDIRCYEGRIHSHCVITTPNLQQNDMADWVYGDGNSRLNVQAYESFHHYFNISGEYDVTLTLRQANGCPTTTKTKRIYFDAEPVHTLTANPTTVTVNENVTFNFSAYFPHNLQDIYTMTLNYGDGSPTTAPLTSPVSKAFAAPGTYTVTLKARRLNNSECEVENQVTITVVDCQVGCDPIECKDCIGSFAPEPGEYILSAWVQQANSEQEVTFDGPVISLVFATGGTTNGTEGPFIPKGPIIDGWQRIDAKFTVPSTSSDVYVKLINTSSKDIFFDDLRIHPLKASMKSFVYDPVSMRLMAELDENNYATFYEYDEEGALIRVKKETERGVKTIKETGNNTRKKP
jgi:hypothetical protein